ncbi:MAG: hypothetical protein ACLP4R_25845 [Solirubrobacteraceae bacterium]
MPETPKQRLAKALNVVLEDDKGQALREQIAREVPAALAADGLRLLIHHELERDVAGAGFATATLMAAELGEGAQRMYAAGLWYPGAALVRQLIECGYLLTVMSESRDEAAAWMRSSHKEVVDRFMVRHMRKRAVHSFRATEYEKHCDLGGHPNPAGRTLLRQVADHQLVSSRCHWLDLAQHLDDVWAAFVAALGLYDPRLQLSDPLCGPTRSPEGGEHIETLLVAWRHADHVGLTASMPEIASQPS